MEEQFDAIVLGAGPGGESVAGRLAGAGRKVALVERELVGGECAYWACIPSKTLLRPPEARTAGERAAGVHGASLGWRDASDYRNTMVRHLDDAAQVKSYTEQGVAVVKGAARVTGPGTVEAAGRTLSAEHLVVATGASAVVPELDGADAVPVWTNREAYSATELPRHAVVVGGSAVGTETATFLAGFGVETVLVHRGERLMEREEPRVGELAERHLRDAGVDVRTRATAVRARRDGGGAVVELSDGTTVPAGAVVFATGRRPATEGLGLERAGVRLGGRGEVLVDDSCRAADGVWAVGDVTGRMPFTHVAKYQAGIVCDALLGRPRRATYDGIPRVVFGDPEIAAAGLTRAQAEERGLAVAGTRVDLAEETARPWTYEREPRGELGLLADADRKVLVGAWAVAPQAGEWIHWASLAIRAAVPLETLRDQVAQFPTYTEGYLSALARLEA